MVEEQKNKKQKTNKHDTHTHTHTLNHDIDNAANTKTGGVWALTLLW